MSGQAKAVAGFFLILIIIGVVFLVLWIEKIGPFKVSPETQTTTGSQTTTTTGSQTTTTTTNVSTFLSTNVSNNVLTSTQNNSFLGTLSNPATSPSQLFNEGIRTNGYYYMNIGDGRGVTQYYVNFTLKGGPYVLIAQNMVNQKASDALFGIQNKNSPSRSPSSSDAVSFPLDPTTYAFNTNILSIPVKNYLVMNVNTSNPANIFYSYIYFVFNESNRTNLFDMLKNVNAKTYGSATNDKTTLPSMYLGKTSGEIYFGLSNPNRETDLPVYRSWSNVDTISEQHYRGWNAENGINYIIEVGSNSRGFGWGGRPELLGFDQNGIRILVQNQIDTSPVPYPPLPMNANSVFLTSPNSYASGTYVVSSSSGANPFNLFNQEKTVTWNSGNKYNGDYTGSEVTNYTGSSSGYMGEWIQIQMPLSIRARVLTLTSANIAERRPPKDFAIFGSKDGTTWENLGMWTNQTFTEAGQERTYNFMENNEFYNYFRFVVNKVTKLSASDTAGYFDLSEMKYFTQNKPDAIIGSNDWHFINF